MWVELGIVLISVRYGECSAGEWTSTRSACNKPRDKEETKTRLRFRFDSKDVTLIAVFAASYVVVNVIQMMSIGNPTIFGPVQLRIADCLIALSALFGVPAIIGVTAGCFLSNAYYFLGPADVVLGPLVNLLAASLVFLLRNRKLIACVVGGVVVGISVGGYLAIFFPYVAPPELSALPTLVAMIISLTISSLITVGAIGYSLLIGLSRPNVLKPLESHGLKTVSD